MDNLSEDTVIKEDITERLIHQFAQYLRDNGYMRLDAAERAVLNIYTNWLKRHGELAEVDNYRGALISIRRGWRHGMTGEELYEIALEALGDE